MKSRIIFALFILVAVLIFILQKNQIIHNSILEVINPAKQLYKQFVRDIKNMSKNYIFQKESIDKLSKENHILKKYLLDQTMYLQKINLLYQKLPSLEQLPHENIAIVDTVSYVKLNSFDKILLTNPSKIKLKDEEIYGLIQDNTVGGIAFLKHGNLYGYLTSSKKCKFSVFIGKDKIPGIIEGTGTDIMRIKYIPRWVDIKKGDAVVTSGLDGIFFKNIPVGKIEKISIENSYKIATIRSLADALHPDLFFLVTNTDSDFVSSYDPKSSFPNTSYTPTINNTQKTHLDILKTDKILQIKESDINISEFEIPIEKVDINITKSYGYIMGNNTKLIQEISPKNSNSKPKKRNPLDIFK